MTLDCGNVVFCFVTARSALIEFVVAMFIVSDVEILCRYSLMLNVVNS